MITMPSNAELRQQALSFSEQIEAAAANGQTLVPIIHSRSLGLIELWDCPMCARHRYAELRQKHPDSQDLHFTVLPVHTVRELHGPGKTNPYDGGPSGAERGI